MSRILTAWISAFAFALVVTPAMAQYAAEVISYNPGATPVSGFTTASASLGEPERFTGESVFPGVVSPFNPPFRPNEIVSVGEGGQLTLRLSHYAVAQAAGPPEIGIFENLGIADTNYPNGQAGSPATAFSIDRAEVRVSADGATWFSLGNVVFDVPANGYTDLSNPYSNVAGSALSDFQQPFVGCLNGSQCANNFDGLPYSHPSNFDMLDLLAGSGGGKWIDISPSGLTQVGYIQFLVADDGNAGVGQNFELDAVSISHLALGPATVPEPANSFAVLLLSTIAMHWRLRSKRAVLGPIPARPRAQCLGSKRTWYK
jgi:hypothetical protein